jgi:hypothetical protein
MSSFSNTTISADAAADRYRKLLELAGPDPANPDLGRVIPFMLSVTDAAWDEQVQSAEPNVTSRADADVTSKVTTKQKLTPPSRS